MSLRNDRKVKVGQVRQIVDDGTMYVILSNPKESNMTKILILSGDERGELMHWRSCSLEQDIVVM